MGTVLESCNTMKVVLLLALCVILTCKGAPLDCCTSKSVGGVEYILVKKEDTSAYSCLSNCLYEKVADPGQMYCFAAGDKKVECKDGAGSSNVTTAPPACSSYPADHTMIKYPGPADPCVDGRIFGGLTQTAKDLLLTAHNELRQKVAAGLEGHGTQPAAANMRKLVWNTELETVAQRWAGQCQFGHDSKRNKCDGTYVGQNAYMSGSSRESSKTDVMDKTANAVTAWYNEVVSPGFNNANIDPFTFDYGAGHYTQVVWADTTEVGCGLTYYQDGIWYKTLVVCNYAIGGNWNGGTMYEIGTGCSACPAGTACDGTYTALCA